MDDTFVLKRHFFLTSRLEIVIVTTILENLFSMTERTRRSMIFYDYFTILLYKVGSLTVCGFEQNGGRSVF